MLYRFLLYIFNRVSKRTLLIVITYSVYFIALVVSSILSIKYSFEGKNLKNWNLILYIFYTHKICCLHTPHHSTNFFLVSYILVYLLPRRIIKFIYTCTQKNQIGFTIDFGLSNKSFLLLKICCCLSIYMRSWG